jgi:hypothetical protein
MKRLAAALAGIALAGTALAQMAGPPSSFTPPPQQQQTAPQPDLSKQLAQGKKAPSKADILRDATTLARTATPSCEVADAALLADGIATINGKQVHVRTFETACSSGIGYFLIDQPPDPVAGFTCFAADATHTADVAAGREPQPACVLGANADVKRAASAVLSRLGQLCQATQLRLIGRDTRMNTELTEVACSGGTGYVIASPLPGATVSVSALSCPDSYRRGVACKLSDNGAPLITMETFKQALVQHKVACTVADARSIGRQNASKRHVVEFKCPEQPGGLVAFIPLEDATAPFEVMNCAEAGHKAHVICTLTK